jgi:cytoplasmic iron level regulating protein YaaA (DUF328/UPF0246 family)
MKYLINCSSSKKTPLLLRSSNLNQLSFHDILGKKRLELINGRGIILDWERTLPAWELYSGERSTLFKHVIPQNWQKECTEILILSALFGWIKHTDLIPYYDLEINDNINNQSIQRYWRSAIFTTAPNRLKGNDFINQDQDIDLLSLKYRRAIHGSANPVSIIPNVIFADKYGHGKGKWLNNQLNNLEC